MYIIAAVFAVIGIVGFISNLCTYIGQGVLEYYGIMQILLSLFDSLITYLGWAAVIFGIGAIINMLNARMSKTGDSEADLATDDETTDLEDETAPVTDDETTDLEDETAEVEAAETSTEA